MAQDPLILALETSGRIGSVAVALGDKILAESTFSAPLRHSAEIFPAISALLQRFGKKPSQVRHVYISVGPGSFTGLRIAVTIAKTMHLANHAKLVAVDTLDVIAANVIDTTTNHEPRTTNHEKIAAHTQNHKETDTNKKDETLCLRAFVAPPIERIAAILDAKRSQFFTAVYQHTSHEPRVTSHGITSHEPRTTSHKPRTTSHGITSHEPRTTSHGITSHEPRTTSHGITSHEPRVTNHGIWKKIFPDSLLTASQFLEKFADPTRPVHLLGDGLLYHKEKFKADGVRFLDQQYWSPRAANVHLLGRKLARAGKFADALTLKPNYLRTPNVTIKQP